MAQTAGERIAPPPARRVKTPSVLQMEAVECGAAALAIILRHYGRNVALEELRVACGISRDGSKATNVVRAAQNYGLVAKGFKKDIPALRTLKLPVILFWNFNHFLVLEGFGKNKVYLNDPASGPRVVTAQEFDESYTGVVLVFEPGPDFKAGGALPRLTASLKARLSGSYGALLYVVLVGVALVIPGLAIPAFSRIFVDDILIGGMRGWVTPLLVGLFLTALARFFFTWLQQRFLLRMETKLALSASSAFLWHVLRLPVEFFAQRFGGEIGSRVQINNRVAQLLSGELATTALNIVQVVFYAAVMFTYSYVLTIICVAAALLNFAALRYVSRKRVDGNRRLLQESGKLLGTAMSGLQIIETLKATGMESDFFARWSGYQVKSVNASQELGLLGQYLSVVPPLLNSLAGAAVLGIGALNVMDGRLTAGSLVAFQTLMGSFNGPFASLVGMGSSLQEMEGSMNRLDDVMRHGIDPLTERNDLDVEAASAVDMSAKLSGYVELKEIRFGYSRLDEPLIQEFSLSLKPGDRVAIVGGSGSGKSTIAKLVAGLYRPWSGEILFDGCPQESVSRAVFNNSVGSVDQDIFMFEGTVRDNVTLWDHTVDEASVVQAARDACIHEDINSRPGGYESLVAEGGSNFSGGQRQRMEIARSLVNKPSVLVMDEATSALDPVTEKIIDENLRRRGCTCLIIAHRLSTIRDCDLIIVMDRGKVAQRGTHQELIGQPGLYASLIQAE